MTPPLLRFTVEDGVGRIVLHRPERRNALTIEMLHELAELLETAADAASGVRVLCLAAEGPAFSAGLDLRAIDLGDPPSAEAAAASLAAVYRALLGFPAPLLCAVAGPATGGGVGLAAAADLVWAGPAARFQLPEAKLGFAPALVSVVLRRRLAPRKLSGFALGAVILDPDEALRIGLVDALSEGGVEAEMDRAARAMVRDLSPGALRRTKAFLDRDPAHELDAELDEARREFVAAARAADARRGFDAFRAKESVRWNE